jgi:zinc protease
MPLLAFSQMNKIDFVEYELDNGLTVILHQDNSTPIVAVSIMYHVGSKDDQPDKTGFAHFFEHLLFEGTRNIPRGQYDKYVERAGGTLNANTSWDRTYYYQIMPSNQLELGLWLESERLLHAKVDEIGIETQRQVIKEERRQTVENRPYGSLLEETMKRLFIKHPYRWPIIGFMEHLDNPKEKDYVDFYNMYYVPNNAILSVAGDIDIKETKKMIEKYYGEIPRGQMEILRNTIVEPPLGGEVRDTVFDNIQLPAVIIANRIPAQGTSEYYAVSMLGTLLSSGESSRFHKRLVDQDQLALAAGSFPLGLEDESVSLAFGITNMGVDPKTLEDAMHEEIDRVKKEIIADREFQKLRNQVENDFVGRNSRVAGIAESLANYKMYYGDANLINTELDRYLAVTKEDIMNAAKKYFTRDNMVVLYYMPKR